MFDGDCKTCSLSSDSDWCLTCKKGIIQNIDNERIIELQNGSLIKCLVNNENIRGGKGRIM